MNEMGEYYGLTVKGLCKLMQYSGQDGVIEINKLGGVEGICEKLGTSPTKGLLGNTVEHRRVTFGSNEIPRERKATVCQLLWNVLCDQTIVILIILAGLALFYYSEILVFAFFKIGCIVVVILVTVIMNYCNERRFHYVLDDVTVKREVTVIRNAAATKIVSEEIVVGDVCVINDNDVVPADGILIESNGLKINESSLTGNSCYANKSLRLDAMVLGGTKVLNGSGTMVAVAVGINARKGNISSFLKQEQKNVKRIHDDCQTLSFRNEKTILQQKVQRLFVNIIYVCLVAAAIIFVVLAAVFSVRYFFIDQRPWAQYVIGTFVKFLIIGLQEFLVGIPEGIPLTVVIVLAITMRRLFRDNKLVRNLHCSETLGNATSICFDKTGTLTTNRMEIAQSYICECQQTYSEVENKKSVELSKNITNLIADNISINSSSSSMVTYLGGGNVEQIGNKTECALLGLVKKFGLNFQIIRENYSSQITHVFPFDSDRKLMGTVIQIPDGYRLFVKGASEVVLSKCKFIIGQNEKLMEMSKELRDRITTDVIQPTTRNRLRTISLAYRDFVNNKTAVNETMMNGEPNWTNEQNIVQKLTCLGVFAIDDPIRSEVPVLVQKLQSFGVTVRMVTGDNIDTATSVAAKCGIIDSNLDVSLDATEFNRRIRDTDGIIQQHLFDEVYPTLRVLARASPMDKYNLVNGISESNKKRHREVVAMVGDGDNDALALKKADVGITFNQISTDVTKNVSTIILTDNNISSIINTVLLGRHAYDSIVKFVQFILVVKLVSVVMVAFFTILSNLEFGIYQADLLINIVALVPIFLHDSIEDVMVEKAHGRNEHIVSKNMTLNIVGKSLYQIVVLIVVTFVNENNSKYISQLPFSIFVVMSLFDVFNARSLRGERNIFRKIQHNLLLCLTWCLVFITHVIATQYLFVYPINVEKPLSVTQWGFCLFFGVGILIWQQLLFTCSSKRKVTKLTSEAFV